MRIDSERQTVELSRTNLLVLLTKLDGNPNGSFCTIEREGWYVRAVEDTEHYADRPRGVMHPSTEAELDLTMDGARDVAGNPK